MAPEGRIDQHMLCPATTKTTWPSALLNNSEPTMNKETPSPLGYEHQSYISPFGERQTIPYSEREKKHIDHCENVSISPWQNVFQDQDHVDTSFIKLDFFKT